jgi:hypothetical protein
MQTIFLPDNSQSIDVYFTRDFWNGEDFAMSPHCEFFKPDLVAPWLCAWWARDEADDGYCSRPDWEERICETHGQRISKEGKK